MVTEKPQYITGTYEVVFSMHKGLGQGPQAFLSLENTKVENRALPRPRDLFRLCVSPKNVFGNKQCCQKRVTQAKLR